MSNRMLSVAVLAAVLMAASVVDADVMAFKRGGTVVTGGNLDSVFVDAINDASIVVESGTVRDTSIRTSASTTHPYNWQNYGVSFSTNASVGLYYFDLSAFPAGATVTKAEVRLGQINGNSGTRELGYITTQPWLEGIQNGNNPGPAGGATYANPAGVNEVDSGPLGWGVAGDAFFSIAGDTTGVRAFKALGVNLEPMVFDVTDIVTDWIAGTNPNYGFYNPSPSGNYNFYLSEWIDVAEQPVLFIDFEVTRVPEPAGLTIIGSLALLGLLGLRRRRR